MSVGSDEGGGMRTVKETVVTELRVRALLLRSGHVGWIGMRALLEQMGVRIVGEIWDAADAEQAVRKLAPDVALIPTELKGRSSAELVGRLGAAAPGLKTFAVGDCDALALTELLLAGASGWLPWRDVTVETVRAALAAALQGGVYLGSGAAVREVLAGGVEPVCAGLDERERAVLEALAAGFREKDVGRETHLSRQSVARVVDGLKERAEAETLFELGMWARQLGLRRPKQSGAPRERQKARTL